MSDTNEWLTPEQIAAIAARANDGYPAPFSGDKFRSDTQALLAHVAALEAEVERLREALTEAREELVKTFTCGCWMQGMEADKFLAQHEGLKAIDATLAAKD